MEPDDALCSLHQASTSTAPFVGLVALAEFDIDKGSCIRAQYPPPDGDVHRELLCEQMLPDRCEGVPAQWSAFFLDRRKSGSPTPAKAKADLSQSILTTSYKYVGGEVTAATSWVRLQEHGECMKFIPREMDKDFISGNVSGREAKSPMPSSPRSVLHGDIIISGGEHEQSISASSNIRLQCIDPVPVPRAQSGPLAWPSCRFVKVDGAGGSYSVGLLLPDEESLRVFERWVQHGTGDDKDPCEPNYRGTSPSSPPAASGMLHCINRVRAQRDSTVRRGAVVKALAIGCVNPTFWTAFNPVIDHVLLECLAIREGDDAVQQQELIKRLYNALNDRTMLGLDIPPRVTVLQCRVWRDIVAMADKAEHEAKVRIGSAAVNVTIPLHADTEEISPQLASVRSLLTTFREGVATILNAFLSEKRVLFLSYQRSAEEVCSCVLATVSLAPSPRGRYLERRVFPYSSLTCMQEWLHAAGFVVGVTNPMFESRSEWWDVLCDIDTGRIKVSPDSTAVLTDPAFHTVDQTVVSRILHSVNQLQQRKTPTVEVEAFARYHLREHVVSLLRSCKRPPCLANPDAQAVYEANLPRFSYWRLLESYQEWACGQISNVVEDNVRKLRGDLPLTEEDSILIFQSFLKHVRGYPDILRFLLLMPPHADGLFSVALSLLHASEAVRLSCVAFLRRLDATDEGKSLISSLNACLLLAFERSTRNMPATEPPR